MISQRSYGHISWYDLTSPTREEIEKLSLVYKLDPLVKEELLTPTLKPKVDSYENCLYVILHFPILSKNGRNVNKEIDFIIGEDFIITTHYQSSTNLFENFERTFPDKGFLHVDTKKIHAGHVFFHMIRALYSSLLVELESVSDVLVKVEKNLFKGEERGMLISLSKINRDVLDFRTATNLHRSVLESFHEESLAFFGKEYSSYTKEILNEYYKINSSIQESKDFLEELRRTNDSLLSNKQNEIMKILTIMAFITFPLTLISSMFGMNTSYLPIVGNSNDFWIILCIMGILTTCFFSFFRFKKWL